MTQQAIDTDASAELLAARLVVHAERIGEALHRPNTHWDGQRSQADMVRAMRPRMYFGEAHKQQQNNLSAALAHMRAADLRRVKGFTDLRNPFNSRQRLTDYNI